MEDQSKPIRDVDVWRSILQRDIPQRDPNAPTYGACDCGRQIVNWTTGEPKHCGAESHTQTACWNGVGLM